MFQSAAFLLGRREGNQSNVLWSMETIVIVLKKKIQNITGSVLADTEPVVK